MPPRLVNALLWSIVPQPVTDVSNFPDDVASACGRGQVSNVPFRHRWQPTRVLAQRHVYDNCKQNHDVKYQIIIFLGHRGHIDVFPLSACLLDFLQE